jgi:hypothetical protein
MLMFRRVILASSYRGGKACEHGISGPHADSSTPGSAVAQTLLHTMTISVGGEGDWLLNEISGFNVPVKRRSYR